MQSLLTVSSAAQAIQEETGCGVSPRDISTLFYLRKLSTDRCPVVGGRRIIPIGYLPAIEAQLRREGKLRKSANQS